MAANTTRANRPSLAVLQGALEKSVTANERGFDQMVESVAALVIHGYVDSEEAAKKIAASVAASAKKAGYWAASTAKSRTTDLFTTLKVERTFRIAHDVSAVTLASAAVMAVEKQRSAHGFMVAIRGLAKGDAKHTDIEGFLRAKKAARSENSKKASETRANGEAGAQPDAGEAKNDPTIKIDNETPISEACAALGAQTAILLNARTWPANVEAALRSLLQEAAGWISASPAPVVATVASEEGDLEEPSDPADVEDEIADLLASDPAPSKVERRGAPIAKPVAQPAKVMKLAGFTIKK